MPRVLSRHARPGSVSVETPPEAARRLTATRVEPLNTVLDFGAHNLHGLHAMLRCFVVAALLTLASSSASAQTVRLDQYQHPSEPEFKDFDQLYLMGVVDGLITYSAAQDARDRFFCIPTKMAITVEQAEDIMLRYAEKKQLPGTVPVAVPLLRGLEDTFPCTKE